MKDKKKIAAALTGITNALKKGYELLKQEHNLPDVPDADMPGYSLHIVKALQQDLNQANEEVEFEGMSYEEIVEKKQQQRDERIQEMLAQAAEDLKKMKTPEPEFEDLEESDGDQPDPQGAGQNEDNTIPADPQ